MLIAKYAYPDYGHKYDQELCNTLLTEDDYYFVTNISMGQSSTTVWLQGFDKCFNSVMFDFYEVEELEPIDIYDSPKYNPYLRR